MTKKVYPNAHIERRLLMPKPESGIKGLMDRVTQLRECGHIPLPFNHFLKKLVHTEEERFDEKVL